MSLDGYHISLAISADDPPFESLLFALMRKADERQGTLLRAAFPEQWAELKRRDRYWRKGHERI